jgi:transcriptional regulator with XRE-family HTH domain
VADESNPTLRRRELGFMLRQLRTERGLSIDDVTQRAMFSPTKLSRLETGRVGASARDIRDLCIVYEINDPAERERLMELAREGKQRGWWQRYDLPYATYIGLEAEAASIRNYDTNVVPGLLQVEGHYIVDEIALRRPVGGRAVMAVQLARIIEVASMPKVTFQIIPLSVGAHPGLDSNFVILELGKPMVNGVVYVEGPVGNIYLESGTDLQRYKGMFSRLQTMASSPEGSIALAAKIAATYKDS